MTALIMTCAFLLIGCMGVCLYRIAVGPHGLDRLLAFDLLGTLLSATVGLIAVLRESWFYMEISMGLAVLAVVGTVAVAHYIERERVF